MKTQGRTQTTKYGNKTREGTLPSGVKYSVKKDPVTKIVDIDAKKGSRYVDRRTERDNGKKHKTTDIIKIGKTPKGKSYSTTRTTTDKNKKPSAKSTYLFDEKGPVIEKQSNRIKDGKYSVRRYVN